MRFLLFGKSRSKKGPYENGSINGKRIVNTVRGLSWQIKSRSIKEPWGVRRDYPFFLLLRTRALISIKQEGGRIHNTASRWPGHRKAIDRPVVVDIIHAKDSPLRDSCKKNGISFELSPCLSRACLGKMIVLTLKRRKKCAFFLPIVSGSEARSISSPEMSKETVVSFWSAFPYW